MTAQATNKILFPVDIVHPHPEYLEHLGDFLPIAKSALHLLFVREELPAYENLLGAMADFPQDLARQIEDKGKEVLSAMAAKVSSQWADVTTEVVAGPPALMIEKVAKNGHYDLVVIGPSAHSKLATYLLGTTSESIVRHSSAPVLIARLPKKESRPLRNVVIGMDGSEEATYAMLKAADVFRLRERDVTVTLVNVVHVTNVFKYISPVRFVAAIEDNLIMSGEALLAQAKNLLIDSGIKKVEIRLKDGDPATEIIDVGESLDAELLVVGSRDPGNIERAVLGSVSAKLATHCPRSTAVFKQPRQ